MADEPDNLVQLPKPPLGKNGKPLTGAAAMNAGKPMSEETKQRLREARAASSERRRLERDKEKAEQRVARLPRREIEERAMEKLKPQAIKALEELLSNRHGVRCPECETILQVLVATPQQAIAASKVVLEHTEGRPAQKIQVEKVEKIEYVLSEHEPAPAQSA